MSPQNADRWRLEVVGETLPPAAMPRAGVLVVGSDPALAGYVVSGTGVESAHCAIGRTKGGGFAIKDLGSVSGTIVNDKRVAATRLRAGDLIKIGVVRLKVVDPDAQNGTDADDANETLALDADEMIEELAARPKSVNPSLPSIPGYRIERLLGRGGMGDVYLAVQQSLARQVALKVLSAKFEANHDFVRRFQAEARAAAALNHPNIVTVFDVGEAGGKHYLSMEYMDRGNLEDRLKNGARITEREVLEILRDATAGLEYAESRGIVHRDLKPANLMQNHVGTTKIADLGLATHVESEEAQPADKKVFGTPHFMSPEQVRGERVDSRSDLYSLGATAYRLLTGRTPFEGPNVREIVKAVLRDEPKPIREFAPDVSDGTAALVERLMKKDSAARYASAAETLAEIARLCNPSQHAVTINVPAEPGRRSKAGVYFVLFLLALLAAWFWIDSRPQAPAPVVNGSRSGAPDAPDVSPPPVEVGDVPSVATAGTTSTTTTPQPETPKEKDDKDLQLFEAQAKLALLELMGREMPETVRRDELRLLHSRFQGTSAAAEALEKADAITNRIVAEENARVARRAEIDALMAKLLAAAALDDHPPHPGRSYLAMRVVDGQAALREDPDFIDRRKTLETVVARTAIAYSDQVLTEVAAKLDKGDWEGGRAQLAELLTLFDLPEFPMGEAPAGVTELFEKGRTARERLHTIEATREVFERRRNRDEALAIAQGFAGESGLERELRALDFSAAKARIEAIQPKLGKGPALDFLTELAADCVRARAVLETLSRECSAGGWRRRSFGDPREKRTTTRNATGADTTGLLFDGDGGVADHIPWSAFGGNTKVLSDLFYDRCTRDWTPAELHGIAALLRLEACIEVLDGAAKMFDAQKRSNFTESNQRDMLEVFNTLSSWAARAPEEKDEIARESEATQILARALRQMTDSQWSTAVVAIERLLTEYPNALLVRLLSNGLPVDEKR
ncbi:MAG: protein kinase [Planctomycetes bacterium]|nr:protein kinase [Planctomycetota bacterium]